MGRRKGGKEKRESKGKGRGRGKKPEVWRMDGNGSRIEKQ